MALALSRIVETRERMDGAVSPAAGEDILPALGSIAAPLPTLEELRQKSSMRSAPPAKKSIVSESGDACRQNDLAETSTAEEAAQDGVKRGAAGVPPSTAPAKKRRRFSENPRVNVLRLEISKEAEDLRRSGVAPKILFFPALPEELQTRPQLEAAVGVGLLDLKMNKVRGKQLAWATFSSEAECTTALLNLRLRFLSLKASLHKPRQNPTGCGEFDPGKNGALFDKKVQDILGRGGLGNTLMLRNLPVEVECKELESVVARVAEELGLSCQALRVRTALSKGKNGRNFWLVYSGIDNCRKAFIMLHHKRVNFRCGKTTKLYPVVHDDSTDADESKRRKRASALGTQRSAGDDASMNAASTKRDSVALLEQLVRSERRELVFMPIFQ